MSTTIFTLYWRSDIKGHLITVGEYKTEKAITNAACVEMERRLDEVDAGKRSSTGLWTIGVRYK